MIKKKRISFIIIFSLVSKKLFVKSNIRQTLNNINYLRIFLIIKMKNQT